MSRNEDGKGVEESGEILADLHSRLSVHFRSLRQRRNLLGSDLPLFALEHGLIERDRSILKMAVRLAVRHQRAISSVWLPFVAYSAEIGYEYSGDEYWSTFEAQTPGWAGQIDRAVMREWYEQFRNEYGGAEPKGAWARHFSIIAWPITHAVLPMGLQVQLARLLFENRNVLSADLLADPAELGRILAARSWRYSSRFQNFTQNSVALGQVAAALLSEKKERPPYIHDPTLKRIVESLSRETLARRWLQGAELRADQLTKHGFNRRRRNSTEDAQSRVQKGLLAEPRISLEAHGESWRACIEFPDLSILAERFPDLHHSLGRARAVVAGVHGPPLARGRLLYPGQKLKLAEWPDSRSPLVTLEYASTETNALLANQVPFPAGPIWLFRVRDAATAVHVRNGVVRPGEEYVLLSTSQAAGFPSWATPLQLSTVGIIGHKLHIPSSLSREEIDRIHLLGLSVRQDIYIRPIGLVPACWDGEGLAEWLLGEDPLLAIGSSISVVRCTCTLDGEVIDFAWPSDQKEIFVALSELARGDHEFNVSLQESLDGGETFSGSLTIKILAPQSRSEAGTFREGLVLFADPPAPSLEELWDGRAALQIVGPPDVKVRISIEGASRDGTITLRRHFYRNLPIQDAAWHRIAAQEIRGQRSVADVFDNLESCTITVSHPALGRVNLRAERSFQPLRWGFGRDRSGVHVRLINNVELPVSFEIREFDSPVTSTPLLVAPGEPIRRTTGGLVTARAGECESHVLLPPAVKDLSDLQMLRARPTVDLGAPSVEEVMKLLNSAVIWASAAKPANPILTERRLSVLKAITMGLVSLIAGRRWAALEDQVAGQGRISMRKLQEAVGQVGHEQAIAKAIGNELHAWQSLEPSGRAEKLASILRQHGRRLRVFGADPAYAEFLLRLCSDPASLHDASNVRDWIEFALESPGLVRAARFVVLVTNQNRSTADAIYGDWIWH